MLPITDHLLWGPAVALIREKTECFWFEARQAKKTLIPYWKKLFCFLNHCSSIWGGVDCWGRERREGGRRVWRGGGLLKKLLVCYSKILLIFPYSTFFSMKYTKKLRFLDFFLLFTQHFRKKNCIPIIFAIKESPFV